MAGMAAGLGVAARTRSLVILIVVLGFGFRIVSHSPPDKFVQETGVRPQRQQFQHPEIKRLQERRRKHTNSTIAAKQ
jgi:hypothetical protein